MSEILLAYLQKFLWQTLLSLCLLLFLSSHLASWVSLLYLRTRRWKVWAKVHTPSSGSLPSRLRALNLFFVCFFSSSLPLRFFDVCIPWEGIDDIHVPYRGVDAGVNWLAIVDICIGKVVTDSFAKGVIHVIHCLLHIHIGQQVHSEEVDCFLPLSRLLWQFY